MSNNDNVFAFIKERDLHEHYMDMLKPDGDLWRGIKCTNKAENEDFKQGAVWSIAWFLISVCANCEKVYLREEKTNLTEFEKAVDKIIESCSKDDGEFDTEKFGSIFNRFFKSALEEENKE